jgi:hypothetical protein
VSYPEVGIMHASAGRVAGKGQFPPLELRDRVAAAIDRAVVETLGEDGLQFGPWYAEAGVQVLNTVLNQRTFTAQGGYLHLSPPVVSKPVWISHVWIVRLHQPTRQPLGAGLYVPGADDRVAIVDLSARHLPAQAVGQGSSWTGEEWPYLWDWSDALAHLGLEYRFREIETLSLPAARHRLTGLDTIIRRARGEVQ